jgi:hypothetical protein
MLLKASICSMVCCLALNSIASVRTVEFTPPLLITAGEATEYGIGNLEIDFNLDGKADLRFVYGNGGITAFLDSTNRTIINGSVAAVPFGTVIGSNLPPVLNSYRWDSGSAVPTNSELKQFGQRQKIVLTTMAAPRLPGSPVQVAGGGGPITQPVLASGDVVQKEGAIAAEFRISGEVHYGYIAVDFRSALGTGGKVLGWAWETEPALPITANRIPSRP